MAVTTASFLVRFPEFAAVDPAVIARVLADSASEVNDAVFGTLTDKAIELRAAHALAISPYGQNARLEGDTTNTTYGAEFERLARSLASGPWLIGTPRLL